MDRLADFGDGTVSALGFYIFPVPQRQAKRGGRRVAQSGSNASFRGAGRRMARRFPGATDRPSQDFEDFVPAGFQAIVLVHQLVALDSVIGWRLTRSALHFIKSNAG